VISVEIVHIKGESLPWVVTVKDQGEGVPEDIQRHVFDPFFTTKSGGVGLGLSIVHRIISGAKGAIELVSRPGLGTTVTVRLPDTGSPKS